MYWLKMLWLKRFWKEAEALPPPSGFAAIYHRSESIIKELETLSYLLQETDEWKRLSADDKKLSMANLATFYKRSHFQCCCLRDELLLTLQRIPGVKLKRGGISV